MSTPAPPARPIVGLVVGSGRSELLRPLARELTTGVTLVALTGEPAQFSGVSAVLASDPAALGAGAPGWDGPTAVVVTDAGGSGIGQLDRGAGEALLAARSTGLVLDAAANRRSGGVQVLALPHGRTPPSTVAAIPVWTRRRWRDRRGGPPTVVVVPGALPDGETRTVAGAVVETLADDEATAVAQLVAAAAAVVDAERLPLAVATTTPCVCLDPVDDPSLGAVVPHVEQVEARDAVAALLGGRSGAKDDPAVVQSAQLLRYRQQQQPATTARQLLEAWGIGHPPTIAERLRLRCEELDLPPASPLAVRLAEHTRAFVTDVKDATVDSTAAPAPSSPIGGEPGRVARSVRRQARRAATAVLDRVAQRMAASVWNETAEVRSELAQVTEELHALRRAHEADLALLRAELAATTGATAAAAAPPTKP